MEVEQQFRPRFMGIKISYSKFLSQPQMYLCLNFDNGTLTIVSLLLAWPVLRFGRKSLNLTGELRGATGLCCSSWRKEEERTFLWGKADCNCTRHTVVWESFLFLSGQAMEIGSAALNILVECWDGHLTPPEVASLADRASRARDSNMVRAAAELALSCLPHAHALNPNEIQRALVQCKEQVSILWGLARTSWFLAWGTCCYLWDWLLCTTGQP